MYRVCEEKKNAIKESEVTDEYRRLDHEKIQSAEEEINKNIYDENKPREACEREVDQDWIQNR